MESSEVERELGELETRIERLRALYEQYFMGIERLEPLIPRKDVERRIWVMRREQIRNTGLRFKFQMLIQRYNTFQQYWGRISREIENGTYRRDVIRAAKRVGTKEALTIVGRKRAERYAELAEQQGAAHETVRRDVGDDHEEIDVDDEAVTLAPPPLPAAPAARKQPLATRAAEEVLPREAVAPSTVPEASSAAPAVPQVRPALVPPATPQAAAAVKPAPLGGLPRGLGLTRPQQKPPEVKPAEAKSTEASGAGTRTAARSTADRNQPAAAGASRQRLAELAAEMRAQRSQSAKNGDAAAVAAGPPGASTDIASEPPSPPPKRPPPPLPIKPPRSPAAAPAAAAPAAAAPAAAALATTAAVVAEARGAGARRQERAHSERPPPSRRRRSTAPPAADTGTAGGTRHASSRPPDAARAGLDVAKRPRPGPPPQRPAARDDELPEQRLRQIYAKYVETKRAARESTAGVTYERLAESLRAQAAKLRATNPAKSVDYDVVVKDGKTLLKPILK
ncbi:MXAN_5187 C-terminal domain-containing protein [Sorangium sp. So ce362]|uniref:MXAN_5187 C-terminal domain-containing protein n=1 Tax=Sorangium sp. So ce362 TaxID=3133303 RepID=UPI003F6371F1